MGTKMEQCCTAAIASDNWAAVWKTESAKDSEMYTDCAQFQDWGCDDAVKNAGKDKVKGEGDPAESGDVPDACTGPGAEYVRTANSAAPKDTAAGGEGGEEGEEGASTRISFGLSILAVAIAKYFN